MEIYSVIIWICSIGMAVMLGERKGRAGGGLFWGLFLGPIGVLIVLCLPPLHARADPAIRADWEQQKADWERARSAAAAAEQDDGSGSFVPDSMRPNVQRNNFERRNTTR
jgi:hypothetical protein